MWMLVGFSICSGVFVIIPTADREFRLRYLMNFVGMKTISYYLGSFLADFFLFMMPTFAFIILLFPMKIDSFIQNWYTILAIMTCFGVALICLTYFIGFAFKSADTAFRQIGIFYIIVGYFIPTASVYVLMAVMGGDPTVDNKWLRYLLFINPFYPFFESLMYVVI
jgi:hypothetical protein